MNLEENSLTRSEKEKMQEYQKKTIEWLQFTTDQCISLEKSIKSLKN